MGGISCVSNYSFRSVLGALCRDCFLVDHSDVETVVIICRLLLYSDDSKRLMHAAPEVFLELVFNERAAFPSEDSERILIVHIVCLHLITLVCGKMRSIIGRNFLNFDIIVIGRWNSVTARILRGKEQRLIAAAMVSYLIFLLGICSLN